MRRLILAAMIGTLVASASAASADEKQDKQACVASSEHAQRLRMDGKLSEARKELLLCARESCPTVVRSDCGGWLAEVNALLPSIVVAARDEKGADLVDAQVYLDGQKILDRLDGKAVVVPTGEHVIRLERAGASPAEQKVLIREGEKARQIDFKFASPTVDKPPDPTPKSGGHTIPPWIVFGAGAAAGTTGVVLYFVGRGNVPSQCDFGTRQCVSGTTDDTKQQAASATGTANLGIVIAIVGGVIAAGGLVWHFVEPTGPSSSASIYPIVAPNFSGAGFSATF